MSKTSEKGGGKMRNGNSWLSPSVPVAGAQGEEKDDRLKLTDKWTFRGRQSGEATAAREEAREGATC